MALRWGISPYLLLKKTPNLTPEPENDIPKADRTNNMLFHVATTV